MIYPLEEFIAKSTVKYQYKYFCVLCKLVIEFHFFACSCPDLPTPFAEEAVFAPFYAPASFVKY